MFASVLISSTYASVPSVNMSILACVNPGIALIVSTAIFLILSERLSVMSYKSTPYVRVLLFLTLIVLSLSRISLGL